MFVFPRHRTTEGRQNLAHGRHIGDAWHVAQSVATRGQQNRRHLLQDSVLGSVCGHGPRQGSNGAKSQKTHLSIMVARPLRRTITP